MTEAEAAARAAIQEERDKDYYEAVVGEPVPCAGVGEYEFPEGVEAYRAQTRCTRHDPPCTWMDYALRSAPQETFRVILEEEMWKLIITAQVTAALEIVRATLREDKSRLN